MNYQFIRNQQGVPEAQFEMGGEILSRWFSDELGNNQRMITQLLDVIGQLQSKQIKEFVLQGRDINLSLDCYEVEIKLKNIDADATDELPDGTQVYDLESISGCGLEDFEKVLKAWDDFVKES
jgi:uncharacterized protein YacL (UPF0231 family)